jgi:hypothetical protein
MLSSRNAMMPPASIITNNDHQNAMFESKGDDCIHGNASVARAMTRIVSVRVQTETAREA